MSTLPVISIVGSTATGKTDLALAIAHHTLTGVDLISADSRQVYQGLEVLSGADIQPNFEASEWIDDQGKKWPMHNMYIQNREVRLFGVSMLPPTQDWSVAHFQEFVQAIVANAQQKHRLVIMVGGTGLYQTHAFFNDPRLHIPPNQEIRDKAAEMSLDELQHWLQKTNPSRWAAMNQSDQKNPRRLVRALEQETADGSKSGDSSQYPEDSKQYSEVSIPTQHFIGLSLDLAELEARIKTRVEARFKQGAVQEVERLLAAQLPPDLPVWSTTGVKEISAYITDQIDQSTCLELWTKREFQYAKRQLTWWKKWPQVQWFEAGDGDVILYACGLIPTLKT
jgi:tRNA dimethylallyltransferase